MENNNQQQERDRSLNETLERAGAFEELIRTKGFEWLQAYYQTRIQAFTSNVLLSDQTIAEFENERQRLIGMGELFNAVKNDLDELDRYRKEQDEKQTAGFASK